MASVKMKSKKERSRSTMKKPTTKKTASKVTNNKNLNKKGLSNRKLILISAALTIIAGLGLYLWQRQKNNQLNANAASGCVTVVYKLNGRSSCITHIQRFLNLQYPSLGLVTDGYFSQATVTAVKNFQTKNGLTVDGVVGSQTWKSLCWSTRLRIEQGVVTEYGNSYISAGCDSNSIVFVNSSGAYFSACNSSGSIRVLKRQWPSTSTYFTVYVKTDSSYIPGYKGYSGPRGNGSGLKTVSYRESSGGVKSAYISPQAGYAYMSPTSTGLFMRTAYMPKCYDSY